MRIALVFLWTAFPALAGTVRLRIETRPVGSVLAVSDALVGQVRRTGETLIAERVSLRLDELKTGIALRDVHMRDRYFETLKHPYAVLKNGSGFNGAFTGVLSLHGIDRPVTGTYQIHGSRGDVAFSVKISDFGIRPPEYMGLEVRDEVFVEAELPVVSP